MADGASTARQAGAINVTFIRAEDVSPLKGIQRMVDITDSPEFTKCSGQPQRGLQAADLALRFRAHWQEVDEVLRQLEESPLARRFLDLRRMRGVLDSVRGPLSPAVTRDCDLLLSRGLGAGLFLLRF